MADHHTQLDHLDQLLAGLEEALAAEDWQLVAALNQQVQPAVAALMTALEPGEAGEFEAEPIRRRLQALQKLMAAADEAAQRARKDAQDALKNTGRNRSAAKAYQNVSAGRSE